VERHAKGIPDPRKYIKIKDWRINSTGKFTKAKKVSYLDNILKSEKKLPGPANYSNKLTFKIKGFYKQ
jgi:hypothetical protein